MDVHVPDQPAEPPPRPFEPADSVMLETPVTWDPGARDSGACYRRQTRRELARNRRRLPDPVPHDSKYPVTVSALLTLFMAGGPR